MVLTYLINGGGSSGGALSGVMGDVFEPASPYDALRGPHDHLSRDHLSCTLLSQEEAESDKGKNILDFKTAK